MKTKIILIFAFVVVLGVAITIFAAGAGKSSEPKYVGLSACKTCHSTPKIGGIEFVQYQDDPHAKAYQALLSDQANKIAKDKGIADPTKSENCMKCHTAAYGKTDLQSSTYKDADGVTCEACHGAGEKYKAMPIMKDLAKAKENGLILPGEKRCVECHNPESPTYKKFDFKTFWEKIKHGKDVAKKIK